MIRTLAPFGQFAYTPFFGRPTQEHDNRDLQQRIVSLEEQLVAASATGGRNFNT